MSGTVIILVQTAGAWFMAGSIWTMQILNYPLLALIGRESFIAYETAHNRRFIAVVGPGVAITTTTTVLLFFFRPRVIPLASVIAAAFLLMVVLVTTALYGAPAHTKLARGFDTNVHASLVRSNWVRTAAWTGLAVLDLWMLYRLAV